MPMTRASGGRSSSSPFLPRSFDVRRRAVATSSGGTLGLALVVAGPLLAFLRFRREKILSV